MTIEVNRFTQLRFSAEEQKININSETNIRVSQLLVK